MTDFREGGFQGGAALKMPILNRVKAELGVNQATQCALNSTKSSTITFSNSTAKISSESFELLKMTNNKTRL